MHDTGSPRKQARAEQAEDTRSNAGNYLPARSASLMNSMLRRSIRGSRSICPATTTMASNARGSRNGEVTSSDTPQLDAIGPRSLASSSQLQRTNPSVAASLACLSVSRMEATDVNEKYGLRTIPTLSEAGLMLTQATTDLIAGTLDLLFLAPPTAMSQLQGGKLKAIGASTPQRLKIAPDVPTLSELGLTGFNVKSNLGVFAPASMPDAVAERISADLVRIASTPDVEASILKTGLVPGALGLQDYVKLVEQEHAMWQRVVRESGIKPD